MRAVAIPSRECDQENGQLAYPVQYSRENVVGSGIIHAIFLGVMSKRLRT